MGRKQKRKQKAPNDEGNSSDSTGEIACSHVKGSVQSGKVRKKVINYKNQCEICDKLNVEVPENNEKFICLQCGVFTCSLDHSLIHSNGAVRTGVHDLVYSVVKNKVWCHKCQVEVSLKKAKGVNSCVTTINSILTKNVVKSEDSSTSKLYGAETKQESASPSTKIMNLREGFPPVRGLVNLGNTCFFNSVLQCLARTPHLLEELRKMEKPGRHVRIELKDGRVLAGELEKWDHLTETLAEVLTSLTERGTGSGTVNPSRLLAALRKKHSQFEGYDQHDAHELLRLLLDSVRTAEQRRYRLLLFPELGVTRKVNPAEVPPEVGKEARDLDHQMSQVVSFTPEHIFKGFLVSKLKCQECSHSTECVEGFLDLSLPIVVDKQQPPSLRKWSASSSSEKKNWTGNSIPQSHMSSTAKRKARRKAQQSYKPNKRVIEESEEKDLLPQMAQLSLSPPKDGTFICPEDGDVEDNDDPTKSDDRRRESGYSSEKGESYSSPRGSPALEDEDSARVSPNPLLAESLWQGILDDSKFNLSPQTLNLSNENPKPLVEDETKDSAPMFPEMNSSEKEQVVCCNAELVMLDGEETSHRQSSIEEKKEFIDRAYDKPLNSPTEFESSRIEDFWNANENVPYFTPDSATKQFSPASAHVTPEISPVDVIRNNVSQSEFSWDAPFAGCDNVSDDDQFLNAKDITPLLSSNCSPTISPILNRDLVGSPDASPNHLEILRQGSPSPVPKSKCFTSAKSNHDVMDDEKISWFEEYYESRKYMAPVPYNADDNRVSSTIDPDSGSVQVLGCSYDDSITSNLPAQAGSTSSHAYKSKQQELTSTFSKEDEYTIQGCLGHFTCVEMMAGNNKVGCSTCTERQNKGKEGKTILTVWSKQLLIRCAPPVLILHLKRFQVLACSSRKLSKHVAFPFTLDLSKFCSETSKKETSSDGEAAGGESSTSKGLVYNLYGLVEHCGHLNSGHYVAYIKVVHNDSTQWFCISDSRVTQVTESAVSKCQAYLLFYSRAC